MNKEAYQTFFYWINERHSIFLNKEAGLPKPWSRDPIFQEWKFCNPFRQNDRQTRWLIDNVLELHKDEDPALILFNIFVFRAFNWHPTYEVIRWPHEYGDVWNPELVTDQLHELVAVEGEKLTSGAYMIRGREGMPKYRSIIQTLTRVWEDKDLIIKAIGSNHSLEHAYKALLERGFWGWGPFTIYQVLLDLTYTQILECPGDINSWCIFGPGAERGLDIIYPGIKKSEYMTRTRELLNDQIIFRETHVPEMNLQDIEFSLCETSKYIRIQRGGHGKERYNAKI